MRNDAHDELEHVPSLTTDPRDRDDFQAGHAPSHSHSHAPQRSAPTYPQVERRRGYGTGPLWALIGALVIALGGLSWWSYQQVLHMQESIVATQDAFARISEEAAGRIQDISGKVVATESSVTSDSEALKLRIKQLETRLAEVTKQQQNLNGQQSGQGKRLDQLAADLKAQQGVTAQFDGKLDKLAAEQKTGLAGVGKLQEQLKGQAGDIEALKKKGDPSQAVRNLEQDLLVLRSELENRPAPQNNTAEFDAFRAQVTRNINALTAQVQNLQQQLNAR
ncbi:ATPase [Aquipseudomonas alcaligenes]|jgi:chromosome segregation ATPase|uniref:ATPase n=1 Tax=Aquipseudomonas alcaligenes TaxID=43263 RepID=A0AA37CB46_AQUAC|nr:ATPase [Pseudomonas alcaligenes]BCR23770.1 ATPase [Pseudomonas alcaligenes]GIZ65221.1 ATPase [Pseudomonas alcaligenes]GIZ69454.1 ATPase [Pseudomonas alcaligenes]GIZ73806.1 ATPase [Pseudomonas alcaligenes]GIZ78167.1 ATPase [Pseudomonas alcaligenes]